MIELVVIVIHKVMVMIEFVVIVMNTIIIMIEFVVIVMNKNIVMNRFVVIVMNENIVLHKLLDKEVMRLCRNVKVLIQWENSKENYDKDFLHSNNKKCEIP